EVALADGLVLDVDGGVAELGIGHYQVAECDRSAIKAGAGQKARKGVGNVGGVSCAESLIAIRIGGQVLKLDRVEVLGGDRQVEAVIADVEELDECAAGDLTLHAEVVALGVRIVLVGCEEADGLPQEGAGSQRRADWLREAVGE